MIYLKPKLFYQYIVPTELCNALITQQIGQASSIDIYSFYPSQDVSILLLQTERSSGAIFIHTRNIALYISSGRMAFVSMNCRAFSPSF